MQPPLYMPVTFDGSLVASETDCLQEQGYGDANSLRDPGYSLILSRIVPDPPEGEVAAPGFDAAYVRELWRQDHIAWRCRDPGMNSHERVLEALSRAAMERMTPADRIEFAKAMDDGQSAAWNEVAANRDAACKQMTPAIYQRLTDAAMGRGSVLHDW